MGRILGIDVGERRLGLAISDESQTLASPYGVYERSSLESDLEYLKELITSQKISEMVLGFPMNMDGSVGPQAQAILEFKKTLEERFHIRVHLFDERLTTAEAERVLLSADVSRRRRRRVRDALAAVLILQGYLDSQRAT
ncbi:MAG: Holliday junction resolvase RuvX [Candidatus Bipolaricaulota bacterium]|nr:Holliday junction resolvase RuvX [Candidatus Bipolaricaulota bacterium]MCS7275221.1 Holliday junction resolvase RuvX [Candidatus Bipolaricaulota bacterium]MDW8328798.1 Holliday junction resolvase RuvX [Candidatus Bipolaricaulota bacterium]